MCFSFWELASGQKTARKNSFAIHIDLFMILRMCWKIVHQFEEVTIFDACESAAPYMFFTFFHSLQMIEMKHMWRVYQLTVLSTHTRCWHFSGPVRSALTLEQNIRWCH